MRIAACIILYQANPSDLRRNILAIAGQIDTLILWRNSPEDILVPEGLPCKIHWMGSGENLFIAKPLNECLAYCKREGFDWLLTMDQDSEFEDFKAFIQSVETISIEGVGIFAPNVNRRYSETADAVEIESTITSGSLCSVQVAQAVGGFREDYQIYWVDSEFCHRLHLAGYKILALPHHNLIQQFGKISVVHGVRCFNYSPTTLYFMFRNMFWMHRQYRSNPNLKCILYTSQLYLKGIVIGENDKGPKLRAALKGMWHGLFRKYDGALLLPKEIFH